MGSKYTSCSASDLKGASRPRPRPQGGTRPRPRSGYCPQKRVKRKVTLVYLLYLQFKSMLNQHEGRKEGLRSSCNALGKK